MKVEEEKEERKKEDDNDLAGCQLAIALILQHFMLSLDITMIALYIIALAPEITTGGFAMTKASTTNSNGPEELKPGKGVIEQDGKRATTVIHKEEKSAYDKFLLENYEKDGGWFAMSTAAIREIVSTNEIKYTTLRVYMYMLTYIAYGNLIEIKQSQISADTGIAKPNVSNAIKELIEFGYLTRDANNPYKYYAPINICYKGRHDRKIIHTISTQSHQIDMFDAQLERAIDKNKKLKVIEGGKAAKSKK